MYKQFWIYKITNSVTNKFYIGQTKNLYDRLKSHKACKDKNTLIVKSIMKYGWENHSSEVLFFTENISRKEADELEKYYIKKFKSYCVENSMGLNLTDGGYYGSISKKSRLNQAEKTFIKWKKKIGKDGIPLVAYNKNGDIIYKHDGKTFYSFIDAIDNFTIQRKNAIRGALNKKRWTFTNGKYIIGFADDDVYGMYLSEVARRADNAKNTPITQKRVNALLSHHKEKHTIPVLGVMTGVFFESIKEFSEHENIKPSSIIGRFKTGKYNGKYVLCKN